MCVCVWLGKPDLRIYVIRLFILPGRSRYRFIKRARAWWEQGAGGDGIWQERLMDTPLPVRSGSSLLRLCPRRQRYPPSLSYTDMWPTWLVKQTHRLYGWLAGCDQTDCLQVGVTYSWSVKVSPCVWRKQPEGKAFLAWDIGLCLCSHCIAMSINCDGDRIYDATMLRSSIKRPMANNYLHCLSVAQSTLKEPQRTQKLRDLYLFLI